MDSNKSNGNGISLTETDRLHDLYVACNNDARAYDQRLNDIADRLETLGLTSFQRKFCNDLLEFGRQSGQRETAENIYHGVSRRTQPLYNALQVAIKDGLDKLPDPTFLSRVRHCTTCDHFAPEGKTLCDECEKRAHPVLNQPKNHAL